MFQKSFKFLVLFFIFILFFSIFIMICFPQESLTTSLLYNNGKFVWPLNGYSYISSYFGKRSSPTRGASSYHSGIDIPAPVGTNILSVCPGIVTFASWGAGGGYTIVVKHTDSISVSYCHVSPNFIVVRGEAVSAGQIISNVGPKNVYGIINNPYKDSDGNPTNGATTGPHLHLTIKEDGKAVNPLKYFDN